LLERNAKRMTTRTEAHVATAELVPYLFFYGRCEEALAAYAEIFGGTSAIMRVDETPMAKHFPPDAGRRVMHATFTAPGVRFMASDGMEDKTVDPDAGNICLALNATDGASGERIFAALAAGGKVVRPIEEAFWGGRFGDVVDRFGTEWMMTLP